MMTKEEWKLLNKDERLKTGEYLELKAELARRFHELEVLRHKLSMSWSEGYS